jgi:hypothetical protein
MVADECAENFWYFLREVYRVPPAAGTEPDPFRANRANISYFWLFFNHITTLLIQPRQTGKSLTYETKDVYLVDLKEVKYSISILVKDDKLRSSVSRKIIDKFDYLPPYLNMLTPKDVKNKERITVKAFNNIIELFVGQRDPKLADNVGRGMTTPTADIDEFAYVPNIEITLPAMLASTVAAREKAEAEGISYGNSFFTTPGKLSTKEGRYAFKVYQEAFRWTEKLFDSKNREELMDYIIKNSNFRQQPIVLLEYNHRQLGFTDKWLLNRIETARAEGEDVEADFFNKWGVGSIKTPLTKKQMAIIEASKQKPKFTEVTGYGYIIRWYKDEFELEALKNYSYFVISVDPSEAIGGDDIGMIIRDAYTGEVIGAGNYNETLPTTFASFLYDLLNRFPNSVLMVERKSLGMAIIDSVAELLFNNRENPFLRMFNWIINDVDAYIHQYPDILDNKLNDFYTYIKFRKHFGFATSGSGITARSRLYGNVLKGAVDYTGDKVYDIDTINQLLSLTVRNNRVDHPEGGHDDLVIAWLISYWLLIEGKIQ